MCHCHVCLDSKIPVQFYFTILHNISRCMFIPPVWAFKSMLLSQFPMNSSVNISMSSFVLVVLFLHLSLPLSHTIYFWEKRVICISLLWLNWFLVPAPELQRTCHLFLSLTTHSLSTFLKTCVQCSRFSIQIVLVTFFHPFSFCEYLYTSWLRQNNENSAINKKMNW